MTNEQNKLRDGPQTISRWKECKICGQEADLFDVIDAGKSALPLAFQYGLTGVPVYLYRCSHCGFCFRSDWDDWDQLDFQNTFYNDDYVKFDPEYLSVRPARLAEYFINRLSGLPKDISILDFGAGSSCFSDHLKKGGFVNVQNYDPFSGLQHHGKSYDVIISTEVLEHVPFPMRTFAEMFNILRYKGLILFTTCLQPSDFSAQRGNWWYAAPRNGHGSFYTKSSLAEIATKIGLEFWTDRSTVHCFSSPATSWRSAVQDFTRCHSDVVLYAPPATEQDLENGLSATPDEWHQAEQINGLPFRWSSSSSLSWDFTCGPSSGLANVTLPVLMSIGTDDVSSLTLQINGITHKGSAEATQYGHMILFNAVEMPKVGRIVVTTPPLVQPGPNDLRHLRIGVATRQAQLALPL